LPADPKPPTRIEASVIALGAAALSTWEIHNGALLLGALGLIISALFALAAFIPALFDRTRPTADSKALRLLRDGLLVLLFGVMTAGILPLALNPQTSRISPETPADIWTGHILFGAMAAFSAAVTMFAGVRFVRTVLDRER
jgi:hypothetical protein